MRFVGLFLDGSLMRKYNYTEDGILEAITDCKIAFEETGLFHELKTVNESE